MVRNLGDVQNTTVFYTCTTHRSASYAEGKRLSHVSTAGPEFSTFDLVEGIQPMQLDYQGIAHPEPRNEAGPLSELRIRTPRADSGWPGWMRTYSRVVGLIQWGYAFFIGYWAIEILRFCYHPEYYGKGTHDAAYLSLVELFFGTTCACWRLLPSSGVAACLLFGDGRGVGKLAT